MIGGGGGGEEEGEGEKGIGSTMVDCGAELGGSTTKASFSFCGVGAFLKAIEIVETSTTTNSAANRAWLFIFSFRNSYKKKRGGD
jgi:hypothetical protein